MRKIGGEGQLQACCGNSNPDSARVLECCHWNRPLSIALPAVHEFSDLIRIAGTRDEFMRHIELALTEADRELPDKRRRSAAQHTWEKRVEQLSAIIQPYLADRRLAAKSG